MSYFPPANEWREVTPESRGFDSKRLAEAIALALQAESSWPLDLSKGLGVDSASGTEPPPYDEVLGPTHDRGGASGLLVRGGECVAQWGDPSRVDMTFSVAKSYLSILAGLAVQDGLIRCVDDRVGDYCDDGGFESAHNRTITWRHLLHQSSEWEGELFGKPDWLDHNRQVGTGKSNSLKGTPRALQPPGSFYEYNDVRVNRLSLSLLQVFERPLPEVLRERIMDPIGASDTWEWLPYRNGWVEVASQRLPSVPGGSHWGGGIFINSFDHARVGLLILNRGRWNDARLLDEAWVDFLRTPSPTFASYGALWWLNEQQQQYAHAPPTSIFAKGAGSNIIWVDEPLDLVGVLRWVDSARADEVIGAFMAALRS